MYNLLSFYPFLKVEAHIEIWITPELSLWDALFLFGLFEPYDIVPSSELRTALMILEFQVWS